jgi:predicted Zn finger-like uncharacterized protein
MIITCGQCQAKFKVALEQIKVTGSKVRCSNCHYVFTVYRPAGPAESPGGRPEAVPPRPAAGDPGSFGDEAAESQKARRERRRLLYAGQEEDGDNLSDNDPGWAESELDEDSGRPPLRRRPAPPEPSRTEPPRPESPRPEPPRPEPPEYEQPEYEQSELEAEYPAEASYSAGPDSGPLPESVGDLGLAADPARPEPTRPDQPPLRRVGEDLPSPAFVSHSGNGEVRAAVTRVKSRRSGLFLALAIFSASLAIGLYFLSSRPQPLALSEGDDPLAVQAVTPSQPADAVVDPRGIEHITFTPKDNLKHFYRRNEKEGELLIITGRVRNSYPAPRSFIRLRGLLLDQNGNTLADRFIYAGNLISEGDLTTLPKDEIMARLNIKGGQNNQNMNIASGQEVPFMVVFDNVPANRDEYRIIPVGSSPAE